MYPRLANVPLIKDLANAFNAAETSSQFSGLPKGNLRGIVTDVNDPQLRGRVKVVFDDFNPDVPQVIGAGEWSEERVGETPVESHWIDVSPAFNGKQPEGLVGKRVNISVSNGEYQYAVLQDVIFDPETLTEKKGSEMKTPNNSSMTRLPIYPSGSLPPASEENHGCMVIEADGPMNADWTCVCLKRNGQYLWVRHVDLAHGHAGENDGAQPPDSSNDSEKPVNEQSVWDYAFPTSDKAMTKQSAYGTEPRPNPYGREATWHEPP